MNAKIVIPIGLSVVSVLLAVMFLPGMISKPNEKGRRFNCKLRMTEKIGPAWKRYLASDSQRENPPASLEKLASEFDIPPHFLECPSSRRRFIYYGAYLKGGRENLEKTILISDHPDNHKGVIHLLMSDGLTLVKVDADSIEEACKKRNLILPSEPNPNLP